MKLNRFEVVSGKCIKEISVQSRIGYSMSDTTDFYDMDEWLKKGDLLELCLQQTRLS